MSDAGPPPKKKEGSLGVILTAVGCLLFLYLLFQPKPPPAPVAAVPLSHEIWQEIAQLWPQAGPEPKPISLQLELFLLQPAFIANDFTAAAHESAPWLAHPPLAAARRASLTAAPSAGTPLGLLLPAAGQPLADLQRASAEAAEMIDLERSAELLTQATALATTREAQLEVASLAAALGHAALAHQWLPAAGLRPGDPRPVLARLLESETLSPTRPWFEQMTDPASAEAALTILARVARTAWAAPAAGDLVRHGFAAFPGAPETAAARARTQLWDAVRTGQLTTTGPILTQATTPAERISLLLTMLRAALWHESRVAPAAEEI